MDREKLLAKTNLLDFWHPSIQGLIRARGWTNLPERERIGAIYDFVRNEIAFGYNLADDLRASQVLADGIGQCNTKGTLFMALLRAAGVPCRFHGFTIDKALQKGAITGVAYALAPRDIIHSWVEVWFEGRWVELEGFILDKDYLSKLQERFGDEEGAFCGFGAATPDLRTRGWSGRARTPTSRRTASTGTSACSTIRTPSTPSTAPTCRASRSGCSKAWSGTG